jgi:hypothetical protein
MRPPKGCHLSRSEWKKLLCSTTLLDGNGRDGEVSKPIEAIVGRHPNVAFPIFEESVNGSVRQAFGWGKPISSSIVDMQEPLVHQGADPQATIVIPQQPVGLESSGKRVRLELPVPQLGDSGVLGNQESTVIAFEQRIDSLRRIRYGIELGWTRLPSPQAIHRSRPEIASAILV